MLNLSASLLVAYCGTCREFVEEKVSATFLIIVIIISQSKTFIYTAHCRKTSDVLSTVILSEVEKHFSNCGKVFSVLSLSSSGSEFQTVGPAAENGRVLLVELIVQYTRWRRGVAVERRTRDREVAGSSLGRALRRKNSGQVSHTYG